MEQKSTRCSAKNGKFVNKNDLKGLVFGTREYGLKLNTHCGEYIF